MPYDPPPELAALSLAEIAGLAEARALPPVEQWQPARQGDSEMRIAAGGRWYHQGGEITRPAMLRAFSALLVRDSAGQHWLVTPHEKLSIEVEDAAFVAVDVKQAGGALAFRLNTDDLVVAGPDHPITARGDAETPAHLSRRPARPRSATQPQHLWPNNRYCSGKWQAVGLQPGSGIPADPGVSTLFNHVSRLYEQGHSGEPPELFGDQRLAGIEEFRAAAVLVALTERAEPGMLLLHRPSHMRSHPGQIAFPGGGIDPGETPVEAALREAHEELGIDPGLVRVIGASDVYKTHSGFEITPVLATVPPDIEIVPNPTEVAQWFEAPAGFVLDPANHKQQWIDWEGDQRAYNEIVWEGHNIWGITAALIVNLSRRLKWHG